MKGFVYILQSEKNNRYYIGSTNDIKRRIKEHNQGLQKATRDIRPLKLVYIEEFEDIIEARRRERKLKSFKSRVIIEKIIRNTMGL